jgi:predicted esterase
LSYSAILLRRLCVFMRNGPIWRHWFLLAAVSLPGAASAASVSDFADFSLRDSSGNVLLPGRLYEPPEAADPGNPRPLMVFLHGSGADGADNLSQLAALSDQMVAEANNWSNSTVTDRVMTMIDRAVAQQNADTDRLYVSGYSNGGGGTWNMPSRYPNRFAAAIEISGVSAAFDFVGAHLINTPVFALHARDDNTAPVSGSRNAVNGILSADHQRLPTYPPTGNPSIFLISNPNVGAQNGFADLVHQQGSTVDSFLSDPKLDLLYVEAPSGGHTGLLGALNFPQPYDWLFSHSLAVPEPPTIVMAFVGVAFLGWQWRRHAGAHRSQR